MRFQIGCAGWSLPRTARASFPEQGSHLQRYAAVFDAVEINSSFYRAHRPQTYARWATEVPPSFRFSVKLPKQISHVLRLKACARPLAEFVGEIEALGSRLGCVLIQLPPSFAFDAPVVKRFLALFRRNFAGKAVIEPRHLTWFDPAVETFLGDFGIGRVGTDPALCETASTPSRTGATRYLRLHGSPRMYYSSYDDRYLEAIAAKLVACAVGGNDCWCIFDNTANGFATTNALRLLEILRAPSP